MTTRVSRRLVALSVVLAAAIFAPAVSSGEESSSASGGRMAAVLQPFVDSHTLAGAVVLVADKNKVLDVEAVGYADVAAKKPMQTDCVFWIASQSKPITAAALMMLVDEGKVKLDDPVEKYLPEFKGQMVVAERDKEHVLLRKPKHPITVRNVLSHTSGLPFASPIEKPTLDLFPLEYRVRSYAMLPLEFEPDSKNAYANAGINTAGRIIEVVSGMPYEKFLDQAAVQAAGHEGHHVLADGRAAPAAGQGVQARPRMVSKSAASTSSSIRWTIPSGSRCRPAACSRPRPTSPCSTA